MRVCQEEDTFHLNGPGLLDGFPALFLATKKAQEAQNISSVSGSSVCAFCAFLWLRKAGEGDGDVVISAPGERQIDESLTGIFD